MRAATRGGGEVIKLELGITVYPPRQEGGRWRAVWHEDGERQQCESVSEAKLGGKLEKVRQRLAMGASNMTKPGAELIAWYLNPDRLPVSDRWSRKRAGIKGGYLVNPMLAGVHWQAGDRPFWRVTPRWTRRSGAGRSATPTRR